MAISKELKIQNIVIIANSFNPSVVNQYWLISNGLIAEKDILPNSIFSSGGVQIETPNFKLIVLPDNLEFSCIDSEKSMQHINSFLLPFLAKIQDVPFTAAGINFSWFVSDNEKGINILSKELFYNKNLSFIDNFDSDDTRFGVYLSKDVDGSRLKMDVKPISFRMIDDTLNKECIQFSFNYHVDFKTEKRHEELCQFINKYEKYYSESLKIVNTL